MLCPWADVLYACDPKWWLNRGPATFPRLKVSGEPSPGLHCANVVNKDRLIWTGNEIGSGGNSGFQALNLAFLWGASKVILTGFDCGGVGHWHQDHSKPLHNPGQQTFNRWIRGFNSIADDLPGPVINASRDTALGCFPRMTIDEALNGV